MTTPGQPLPLEQKPNSISLETQRMTLRERLQRRFEVWLDEALNPEAVPQGLAMDILEKLEAEHDSPTTGLSEQEDMRTVCAALVELTQTARSQDAALEHLHQDLPAIGTLTETVAALLDSLANDRKIQAQEREKEEEKHVIDARRQVFQNVLGPVMDMRDRLCEGLTESQARLDTMNRAITSAPRKRWWQTSSKMLPSPDAAPELSGLETLIKSNQLALNGLDQALTQWHVELIGAVGQPVNSKTMKVVDHVTHSELAEGTVVKVLRAGYTWHGTLCRPAEVCVVQSAVTE